MNSSEARPQFGAHALQYEAFRPEYPEQLFDDVLEECGRVDEALEVGAGTGKATRMMARRGVHVVALEPDHEMADVGGHNCEGLPVRFERSSLENWRTGQTYDLIFSAQAWHWVDSVSGRVRLRDLLEPRSVFAVWWNQADDWKHPIREAIDEVYRQRAPELLNSVVNRRVHRISGSRFGTELGLRWSRAYRWSVGYRSDSYAQMLKTHSDHFSLNESRLADLLEGIAGVIDSVGGGEIEYPYRTDVYLFRRVRGRG